MKRLIGMGLVAAVLAFVGVNTVLANMYGVDLGGSDWANSSPTGPTGASQLNWNHLLYVQDESGYGPGNLGPVTWTGVHDENNANSISLTLFFDGSSGTGAPGNFHGGGATDAEKLYGDGITAKDNVGHWSTASSPFGPSTPWKLYVYTGVYGTGFELGVNYAVTDYAAGAPLALTQPFGSQMMGFSMVGGAGDPPVGGVPEPGTMLLLGGSLMGLAVGAFRRLACK